MSEQSIDHSAIPAFTPQVGTRGLPVTHIVYLAACIVSTFGWCWLLVWLAMLTA